MSCIGEMLKTFRANRQMSLQDVADKAELSKAHIWDIERGKVINLTIETVCKLGVALDMDPTLLCSAAIVDHGMHIR